MGVSTPVYRQCAVCYTDFGLLEILPTKRHKAVGKRVVILTTLNDLIQCVKRISRLVRETLSFFKKLENHMEPSGISSTTIMPPYLFSSVITTYLPLPFGIL